MKYRMLISSGGSHYPQFKMGFFSFWRHFNKIAERSLELGCTAVWQISTNDPQDYAVFGTEEESLVFLTSVKEKINRLCEEGAARTQRVYQGIPKGKIQEFK